MHKAPCVSKRCKHARGRLLVNSLISHQEQYLECSGRVTLQRGSPFSPPWKAWKAKLALWRSVELDTFHWDDVSARQLKAWCLEPDFIGSNPGLNVYVCKSLDVVVNRFVPLHKPIQMAVPEGSHEWKWRNNRQHCQRETDRPTLGTVVVTCYSLLLW